MAVSQSDWKLGPDEDHPIRVIFPDGETKYLSVAAAVERLSDQWSKDRAASLLMDGHELVRWTGAKYQAVR